MNKKAIFIISASILALLLLLYLSLSTKIVTVEPAIEQNKTNPETTANKPAQDPEKLEEAYKRYVKSTLAEFESLLNPYLMSEEEPINDGGDLASPAQELATGETELHLSELSKIKISLMDVTVPQGFQGLHIELVKLFTNARLYLEGREETVKNENLALLEKIKIDNPWVTE